MTQKDLRGNIANFFKDKHGKWAVAQFPNVSISIWIVLSIISLFVQGPFLAHLNLLRNSVLFVWAYLEVSDGDSPFRRVLGSVVLVAILVGYFVS